MVKKRNRKSREKRKRFRDLLEENQQLISRNETLSELQNVTEQLLELEKEANSVESTSSVPARIVYLAESDTELEEKSEVTDLDCSPQRIQHLAAILRGSIYFRQYRTLLSSTFRSKN